MRNKAAGLLLGLIGIVVGIMLLELTLRLVPPPLSLFTNYGDTYVCSPPVGWLGRPNYQGILAREEYSRLIRFNSAGMYDTDHDPEKPDNSFRILWIGDSFAQTLQVDESLTAHQQLENLLNERFGPTGRSFEVINAGVIGWGTGQELVYYREQGRSYQPDLVLLLFFVGNDVNDNLPGHALTIDGFNCFAPYFPVCEGKLDPEPWPYVPGLEPAWGTCSPIQKWLANLLSWVQRTSYLFARIEPLLLSMKERKTYGQNFGLPFAALYLPDESAAVSYGWNVSENLLAQFDGEAEQNDTDFAVIIVGPREVIWLSQLTETQLQSFYESDPVFVNADINRPNRRLGDFLWSQDIPALDLQQPMIDYIASTGAQLYLPIDRHWTAEGNRVAAEFVLQWLIENDLLADQANDQ